MRVYKALELEVVLTSRRRSYFVVTFAFSHDLRSHHTGYRMRYGAIGTARNLGGPIIDVNYEIWDIYTSGQGCVGSATQTGSIAVGSCTNLDFYSTKLTVHEGVGAHCTANFWNAANCVGAEAEPVALEVDEQSGCIVPVFNGTFNGMFPEEIEAKSIRVDCIFLCETCL